MPTDATEIEHLNRAWMKAYADCDIPFLERYLAEGYVGTFPDGTVADKAQEIDGVRSGRIHILSMEPVEMNAQVHGDAAVLTGRSHIKAEIGGEPMEDDFRFTDVWMRIDGAWRAVASQVTRIAVA